MKRILINATQKEELRVAMVNGQKLYDLDIEVPSREQKKSNIYKAKITRVEPSLEAVFVNYGADRHGFLPFKEISREYIDESAKDEKGKLNIKAAIKVDQEIIVQVEKEERGNKGAALTTFISLAGRFLVAMPQNPKAGGVSRRIEGEERDQVRKVLSELSMPTGMGVIVRTAGVGRSTEEMQWDLDSLSQVWFSIEQASKGRSAPFLIYQESDIVVRALRDHYKSDVGEIIIDSQEFYDRAHTFMEMVMPNSLHKLKLFDEKLPLFNRFQIESQIETAFSREVNLPSGGAIVIDHTEALISVDVNSARATKGSDIEATAKNTNLEAADEIARQLRIRDLGGLVVIDFIDMLKNSNQREVELRLRNAVYEDRARVQTTRISRFGLMEMSRQRLRPSLGESSQIVCPRCTGQGTIRDTESLSLAVLRLLEEESLKDNTGRILVKIPVNCATYILNEKRKNIADLEDRHKIHVVIIPDPKLETPHFEIERVRESDAERHESSYKNSYELTSEDKKPTYDPLENKKTDTAEKAAVQRVSHTQPKPPSKKPVTAAKESSEGGFISKIIATLFGSDDKKAAEEAKKKEDAKPTRNNRQQRGGRRNNQNRNNRNKNKPNNPNRNQQNAEAPKQTDSAKEVDSKTQDQKNVPNNNAQNKPNNGESKPRNNRNRNRNRNQRKPQQKQTDQDSNVSNQPAPQSTPNNSADKIEANGNHKNTNQPVTESPNKADVNGNQKTFNKNEGNVQASSTKNKPVTDNKQENIIAKPAQTSSHQTPENTQGKPEVKAKQTTPDLSVKEKAPKKEQDTAKPDTASIKPADAKPKENNKPKPVAKVKSETKASNNDESKPAVKSDKKPSSTEATAKKSSDKPATSPQKKAVAAKKEESASSTPKAAPKKAAPRAKRPAVAKKTGSEQAKPSPVKKAPKAVEKKSDTSDKKPQE